MSIPSSVRRAAARALVVVVPLAVAGAVLAASVPHEEASVTVVSPAAVAPARGYSFVLAVEVPLAPPAAYDAFTAELPKWWDHTLSGDPAALSFDPRPAGGFVERFPQGGDAGPADGARHATITLAERGARLVFLGQLGLVGLPILAYHDLRFEAVEGDAARTEVTLLASGVGVFDDGVESVVQDVWTHFLARYADHAATLAR